MRRVWVILFLALCVSGCVGMRLYAIQKKCAWCKHQIVNTQYDIYPVAFSFKSLSDRFQVRIAGISGDSGVVGWAPTYEDAIKLCEQHALQNAGGTFGVTKDGVTFCSLRCLNAYEASTGIKEQRIRIIEGE